MNRSAVVVASAVVGVVALVVFLQTRPPPGVESMDGGTSSIVPWVSLATAVVGLLTAATNLVLALRKPRA